MQRTSFWFEKVLGRAQTLLFILLFLFAGLSVSAQSISIPLNTALTPAKDLLDEKGQEFDYPTVIRKSERGDDLSLYNPAPRRIWQNAKYSAADVTGLPADGAVVQIVESEGRFPETGTEVARVRLVGSDKEFRFILSRYTHTNLFRAALMRKLGYYVPSPKLYQNLTIQFPSEDEKKKYLDQLQEDLWLDLDEKKWISKDDKINHSITLISATLEPLTADYFPFYMGINFDPRVDSGKGYIELFKDSRSFRAMIFPVALTEVPESINRYSADFALRLAGSVVVNHSTASAYKSTNADDAKWILRRLVTLTESDLQEIKVAAQWPSCYGDIVLAKLKHRIANALESFEMKALYPWGEKPDLKINCGTSYVKDGKIMKEFYPGYPQRFAHGDRPSPFNDEDIFTVFNVKLKSASVAALSSKVSEKMQIFTVDQALQKHIDSIKSDFIDHLKKDPSKPFERKVKAWGGLTGGFRVNGSRNISTGTYYGSTAPIQLVDSISIAADIGYFLSIDGMKTSWVPTLSTQLAVMREYTHVRPVSLLKEVESIKWQDLMVSSYMKNLVANIDSDKKIEVKSDDSNPRDPFDAFLADMKEGEVFTVTDSVVTGVYSQVSSSLDALMGITPLNFLNSLSGGVDASRVTMKQVSFQRNGSDIHVYVRKQNAKMNGVQMDFNYFINLLRLRSQTSLTDLKTDAFIIAYDPSLSGSIEEKKKEEGAVEKPLPAKAQEHLEVRRKLKSAIKRLFVQNNPKEFYRHFQYDQFAIDHNLKTTEFRAKALWERVANFNEEHLLKIRYPKSKEHHELKPEDDEVVLFSSKKGELAGRDLLGFGIEWIEGLWNKKVKSFQLRLAEDIPNPANTLYGKASWRVVNTESDLSKTGAYPSISILQHVWGGWSIKRKDLDQMIDQINERFKGTAKYRMIRKEAFGTAKSLDFYKITSSLSLLPGGIERVRDLMLQPSDSHAPVEKAQFLSRLFQKLSQHKYSSSTADKKLFTDLITLIGNGNYQEGFVIYQNQCRQKRFGEANQDYTTAWLYGSTYECLTDWMSDLIRLSREYPVNDKVGQTRWGTEVLFTLEKFIPLSALLDYVGEKNFLFVNNIFGFRSGDEDGDLEVISSTVGEPEKDFPYANGLINMYSRKTRISPIELDRSQVSFR